MSVVTRLRKSTTEVKRCGGSRTHPRGYWVHKDTGVKTYFVVQWINEFSILEE